MPEMKNYRLDKATTRDYDALAYAIESQLGRLDGILHNAAHVEILSPLEQQSAEEWNRTRSRSVATPARRVDADLSLSDGSRQSRGLGNPGHLPIRGVMDLIRQTLSVI